MIRRVLIYLHEMFPPFKYIPAALGTFLMYFFSLSRLEGINQFSIDWSVITGALSVILFLIFLRISDELKDYESDKIHFPNRPLQSGRVKKSDLKVLFSGIIVILIILNFSISIRFLAFVILLCYSLLMYKWFFIEEKIKNSLPLALFTHNPIVFLLLGYIYIIFLETTGGWQNLENPDTTIGMIIPIGLAGTLWEISRKIKSPDQENDYTTYSKIWGYKKATLLALICLLISAILILKYFHIVGANILYIWGFVLVFIGISFPYIFFFFTQRIYPIKLKTAAEYYSFLLSILIIVEAVNYNLNII